MTIEEKAAEVCHILQREQGVPNVKAFDPATILIIISIITQLVRLFRSGPCGHSPEEAVKTLSNPGWFAKWRMRRIIRDRIRRTFMEDQEEQILNAILRGNETVTIDDMSIFYRDVK